MLDSKDALRASLSVGDRLVDDMALLSDVYLRADSNVKKFSNRSTDLLLRIIVSRHYASACWELSHLLWALSHSNKSIDSRDIKSPILDFFWLEEAIYPNAAKSWFTQRKAEVILPDMGIVSQGDRLCIQIREHTFELTFSRINVLACLAEFVVNIHPKCINDWQDSLWQQGLNAIRKVSSDMQKYLYDYLSDHLPPVRMSKKHAYFMANTNGAAHISRQNFIDLWRGASDIEGLGRLNAFFESYMAWAFAQDYASKYSETAHINELETQINQVSANEESVFQGLQDFKAQQLELPEFAQKPKLLSKSQIDKLSVVAKFPEQCIENVGALFVNWVFSPVQATLIQALRNKATHETLLEKANTKDNYQSQLSFLRAIIKLNEQTMMACWQIIRCNFSDLSLRAFTLNNTWVNMLSAARHKVVEGNSPLDDSLNKNASSSKVTLTMLEELLPSFMENCQQALKKNNRQGFTAQSTLPEGQVYIAAIEGLVIVNKLIARMMNKIQNEFDKETSIQSKFLADRLIVKGELVKRYVE